MSVTVLLVLVSVAAVGLSQPQPFDATSYAHRIFITGAGEGCEQEGNITRCRNLDDVKDWSVNNSTAVLLQVPNVTLSTYIPLADLEHIAIVGSPEAVTVECGRQDNVGTGFGFNAVRDIVMREVTFTHCGELHSSTTLNITNEESTVLFRSALYLVNCSNAVFFNVNLIESTGRALSLFDTTGVVDITKCNFSLNYVPRDEAHRYPGGGGVYVEFTYCSPGVHVCNTTGQRNKDSVYSLRMCSFTGNYAESLHIETTSTVRARGTNFQGMGRGGGIGVFFKGDAQNNTVYIHSCNFVNNSGNWGGALYIMFQDSPMGNEVQVYESNFTSNTACGKGAGGGGAVNAGLLFFDSDSPQHNHLHFHNCNFTENVAVYGGGVNLFSSLHQQYGDPNNSICFDSCVWIGNRAEYGSAMDVSRDNWNTLSTGVLPKVILNDCKFYSNAAIASKGNLNSDPKQAYEYYPGRGVFTASAFPVDFGGNTVFIGNDGTAMYITSTLLAFRNMSSVTFVNNTGLYGGAMGLIGYSFMRVNDDSTFTFTNNTSSNLGGAIFFKSINARYSFSSLSCFIQYQGDHDKNVSLRNISFTFEGNMGQDTKTYSKIGNSIFATSLKPCFRACSGNNSEVSQPEEAMECVANFTFLHNATVQTANSTSFEVSTVGAKFEIKDNSSLPLRIIPGKVFYLPIDILDDFGIITSEVCRVSMNSSNITLDNSNLYTSSALTLYGNPGDTGFLVLLTRGFQSVAISINVELQKCPPGFILLNSSQGLTVMPKCVCSANMDYSFRYRGILLCNSSQYYALLKNGYWIGYKESIDDLVSGYCPARLCSQDSLVDTSETFGGYYQLPDNTFPEALDRILCGESRTGRVCGNCTNNNSVYFHSYNFLCDSNTNRCSIGWLFYILSELIPLTILFLVVMVFGISFTSGALNGFIFFAQVFDCLTIDAQGLFLIESTELKFLIRGSRFIYRFLNLEFFSTDELSFCLWKGASALDILVFKYVTVVYALLLVVASVLIMKHCTCYMRCRCCHWITPRTVRNSVIHGLSAFLVMCYTQVTAVSFYILTPIGLRSRGNTHSTTVVAYHGETIFFSKEHLPYAIPALFCLMTLVAIPPILLLSYPLYYRLFSLLHSCDKLKPLTWPVSRSIWLKRLSHYISIGRMKPLLDSFQSCFKDDFRFFAGLYFVYRIAIHGARVFMSLSVAQFYSVIELELLFILTFHSLTHPYQQRRHNILDSLLFFNMAVINGITLYNYSVMASTSYSKADKKLVTALISVQVILVYLPLLYIMLICGLKFAKYIRSYYNQHNPRDEGGPRDTSMEDFEYPERMLEEVSEYHLFGGSGHSPM